MERILFGDNQFFAVNHISDEKSRAQSIKSIKDADIYVMDIYRVSNRLFMIMEAGDDFSFEKKAAMDASNDIVVQWEKLLWDYQQALPNANPGEKWVLMNKIFSL